MPIIVGSPRSGTTLLRLMLDSHPQLAIPPETGFLLLGKEFPGAGQETREQFFQAITSYPPDAPGWGDFHIPAEEFRARLMELSPFSALEGFRLFYRMYAARFGKCRWGDKTPAYCHHLAYLDALLPESRFVHIVRDGRDCAVSLREQWFSPGRDIKLQAQFWRDHTLTAREQGARCRDYLEVRFEDLLQNTDAVLRRICSFLDLDYRPEMLHYPERAPARLSEHLARFTATGSLLVGQEDRLRQQIRSGQAPDASCIGSWKKTLSEEECLQFEVVAGDALREFGYETLFDARKEIRP